MRSEDMIDTHPESPVIDGAVLAAAIDACVECAQACAVCADACLGEPDVAKLATCIRLNLDCADLCQATARVASRQQPPEVALVARTLELCALACDLCGDECERHAEHHQHCRVCMEVCRRCEAACQEALRKLPGASTRPVIPAMQH
jgi:hypothetical protein